MNNQEKIIKLINIIEELFDYFDIDDIIMTNDYDNNLKMFSKKIDEIFIDGLNSELLEMISKIDKTEIFYIEKVDEYKNNEIRKQIKNYLDNLPLYLDYELIKKYIKNNYKLAKYIKNKDKLLELIKLNEKVILLLDAKYLSQELILEQMKKSNLITQIFLGIYGKNNILYRTSIYYKNSEKINSLLLKQISKYLEEDVYKYIKSSELVKSNIDIAKLVLKINPKFIYYIDEEVKKLL